MTLGQYFAIPGNEEKTIDGLLLQIPEDVEQLTDNPLKQAYIVSLHANGTGIFISEQPLQERPRTIIPIYPKRRTDVLEWEIIEPTKP